MQKMSQGKIWEKGIIYNGMVTNNSIGYVTKYLIDKPSWLSTNQQKNFSVMSNGLGACYLQYKKHWHKQKGDHHDDYRYYVMNNGFKQRLPRYYKDKIFSKIDRLIAAPAQEELARVMYWNEITRISKTHPDPEAYYEHMLIHKHESIRTKSLTKNRI